MTPSDDVASRRVARGDTTASIPGAPSNDLDLLPEPLATIAATAGAPGLALHDHGPHHWKCVALTGLDIALRDRAIDLQTIYLFAQLHDSQRLSEYDDPEHGPRALRQTLGGSSGSDRWGRAELGSGRGRDQSRAARRRRDEISAEARRRLVSGLRGRAR